MTDKTKPDASVEPTQADELRALIEKATQSDLADDGRYFSDSCNDLTSCRHGETGEYNDSDDGKLVEFLWNNRHDYLARLAHQTPPATQPTATVVTAQMLHHALNTADDERHGADQAYMCHDVDKAELDDFLVDGRLNLVRAAEVLNATLHTPSPVATATVVDAGACKHRWAHAPTVGYFQCIDCGLRHEHGTAEYDRLAATPAPPAGGQ